MPVREASIDLQGRAAMPTTDAIGEQVIEAVVAGPDGANRLFTVIGLRFWHRCASEDTPCSSYAKFYRRSHNAVIRIYDNADNVIATHEPAVLVILLRTSTQTGEVIFRDTPSGRFIR